MVSNDVMLSYPILDIYRVVTSVLLRFADHPWLQNANTAPNVSLGETVRARLKQFTVMNKLKKRALRVNIYSLPPFLLDEAFRTIYKNYESI